MVKGDFIILLARKMFLKSIFSIFFPSAEKTRTKHQEQKKKTDETLESQFLCISLHPSPFLKWSLFALYLKCFSYGYNR